MSTYSENTRSSSGRDGSGPNASDGTDELISRLRDLEANLGFAGKDNPQPVADIGGVRSELDIARGLVEVYGDRLRYVRGLGWLVWVGTHWQSDNEERAREFAKDFVAFLRTEGAARSDEDLTKLAFRTGRDAGIRSVLNLARSDPRVRVNIEALDANPFLLACKNGTLDLSTGELGDPDPADLITRLCPVEYDPNAEAPMFERFLSEVQPGQEVREYLARLFGYGAVGVVREHVIGVLWGPGNNGKSVLADVVMYALGSNAKPGPRTLIVSDGKHTPHPTDIASCSGTRLVIVHETKRGASFDASKVKLLTGGDRLPARFMHKDYFEFAPTHTLLMLSNYKPQADATDSALWRRVQLVPFEEVIPEDKIDRQLAEKIKAEEAAGVLRWIVEGALQWQEQELNPPNIIREQTNAYKVAEDIIGRFIEERCVVLKPAKVKAGVLYAAFKEWCQSQGEHPVRSNDFFAELIGRGFGKEKTSTGKVYKGIGLHAAEQEVEPRAAEEEDEWEF